MLGIAYPSSLNLLCLNCWAGILAKLLNTGVRFLVCLWLAIPKWGALHLWKLRLVHTSLVSFRLSGKGVKEFWKRYEYRCFKIGGGGQNFFSLYYAVLGRVSIILLCQNNPILSFCLSKSTTRAIRECGWKRIISWTGERYGWAPPAADWDSLHWAAAASHSHWQSLCRNASGQWSHPCLYLLSCAKIKNNGRKENCVLPVPKL